MTDRHNPATRRRSRVARQCRRCGAANRIRYGQANGHQRWRCRACGRTWNERLGTPLFHLHTPLARGSLRAAEELTGHNYDTIAIWIRRLGEHAAAVTDLLVRDLALSEVEVDEFWSFVAKKGDAPRRRGQAILRRRTARGSAGAA